MLSFKWRYFEKEIILINVRWYLAYPLSYRHLEEMAEERGYHVDHSTINRWIIKYSPELEKKFSKRNVLLDCGGGWMKPTLKLMDNGNIFIERLIKMAIPLTTY